ncbi:MAG: glutathione S-transferase family protein [Methylococcaceae bacterium]|nr:glutathione S-transferase family protein [Methylococcaceae bacterium]
MINLYTANTFNGQRVSIMLEEIELPYKAHKVDLAKGEQRQAEFLQLNPSGRIPVLVDQAEGDVEPLVITQSTAILQYLAEKSGKLLPESIQLRAKVYEWMNFHAIDIGSVIFSAFYLQQRCSPRQIEAAEILRKRVVELYTFFDQQLSEHEFIAGDDYSIADITALPVVITQEQKLTEYSHLNRWLQQLKQRPAVLRGMAVPVLEVSDEN